MSCRFEFISYSFISNLHLFRKTIRRYLNCLLKELHYHNFRKNDIVVFDVNDSPSESSHEFEVGLVCEIARVGSRAVSISYSTVGILM